MSILVKSILGLHIQINQRSLENRFACEWGPVEWDSLLSFFFVSVHLPMKALGSCPSKYNSVDHERKMVRRSPCTTELT